MHEVLQFHRLCLHQDAVTSQYGYNCCRREERAAEIEAAWKKECEEITEKHNKDEAKRRAAYEAARDKVLKKYIHECAKVRPAVTVGNGMSLSAFHGYLQR